MIKMMLTVVVVYTISWLPFNIFLVYGDIWNENLYEENHEVVSYIYPVIHWLAMAHSVWNPVIYCYMNSRFREGFKAAISNVPCIWKIVRFCQLTKSRRSRSSSMMTDSTRRRMSYYSHSGNTRLTRTNTTCTTYTFGSGSLHNIHNTSMPPGGIYHQHHNYAMNNPLMLRKQSFLLASNINGTLNGRDRNGSRPSITSSSLLVSKYPKPTNLNITGSSSPLIAAGGVSSVTGNNARSVVVGNDRNGLQQSNTMTSLAPGQSSSLESSPSSPGRTNTDSPAITVSNNSLPISCLKQQSSVKNNGIDLNNGSMKSNIANGKKRVSLKKPAVDDIGIGNAVQKTASLSPIIGNGSSYVTVSSKGGKEVVTTTVNAAGKMGKSISSAGSTSSTSKVGGSRSFLNRKRSSNSSDVSESFM